MKYMQYEKTGVMPKRVTRKYPASLTKDINKLGTMRILMHLYKRHEIDILYGALSLTYALLFMHGIKVI